MRQSFTVSPSPFLPPSHTHTHSSSFVSPQSEEGSEEELDLPQTAESCLQMNLVYQEVLREKMEELEKHLADNKQQQVGLTQQQRKTVVPVCI